MNQLIAAAEAACNSQLIIYLKLTSPDNSSAPAGVFVAKMGDIVIAAATKNVITKNVAWFNNQAPAYL